MPLYPRLEAFVGGVYLITMIFQPEVEYNNHYGLVWIGAGINLQDSHPLYLNTKICALTAAIIKLVTFIA